MGNGDEKTCVAIRGHLTQSGVLDQEADIQHATKFLVKSGAHRAVVLVFNSGKIVVQGADSELKQWLDGLKQSIEAGTGAPTILLPAEIEKFPRR